MEIHEDFAEGLSFCLSSPLFLSSVKIVFYLSCDDKYPAYLFHFILSATL